MVGARQTTIGISEDPTKDGRPHNQRGRLPHGSWPSKGMLVFLVVTLALSSIQCNLLLNSTRTSEGPHDLAATFLIFYLLGDTNRVTRLVVSFPCEDTRLSACPERRVGQ
jgi:hypothetical protein